MTHMTKDWEAELDRVTGVENVFNPGHISAVEEVVRLRMELYGWQRDLLDHVLASDDVAANRRCGEQYDRITGILSHGRATRF